MSIQIPDNEQLTTKELGRVFERNRTTATYKFYWFLALIDAFVGQRKTEISIKDLTIGMVAHAWYTINYFKLSFGNSDSLHEVVYHLQKKLRIPMDFSKADVFDCIKHDENEKDVAQCLKKLENYVPFHFLSPWIQFISKEEVILRSQRLENKCLYSICKKNEEFYVVINPAWHDYLNAHHHILKDFTYWNLTQFLEIRNPNVPNISNKLIRPDKRDAMKKQHDFWNCIMQKNQGIKCIYTGKSLEVKEYELDHFIPWSFVTHNQLWNLIPSDSSINSIKNDKIPNLKIFLPNLAREHRVALNTIVQNGELEKKFKHLIEDYSTIGTIDNLLVLSQADFEKKFYEIFEPLAQTALNMGFEPWTLGD